MSKANKHIAFKTNELTIGYHTNKGNKIVHSNVNLTLYSGEVTCLLGLNGAGKSTLLRTLCGFQPPLKGNVMLRDKTLSEYSQSELNETIHTTGRKKTYSELYKIAEAYKQNKYGEKIDPFEGL